MPAFNRMSKMGLIRHSQKTRQRLSFSQTDYYHSPYSYLLFQKVEKARCSHPLAYSRFCLVGCIIIHAYTGSSDVVYVIKKNVRERTTVHHFINEGRVPCSINVCAPQTSIGLASIVAVVGLWMFTPVSTEFLPQLNEGSIYIRATLPQSISLDESVKLANQIRAQTHSLS